MLEKVSLYLLLPMLILSFFLAMFGVTQIEFGESYYSFLASVGKSFETWKLTIPDIPKIPLLDFASYDSTGVILRVLIKIANGFFKFINLIVTINNVIINIFNIIIQIIQFILTIIYQCKDFITRVAGVRVAVA